MKIAGNFVFNISHMRYYSMKGFVASGLAASLTISVFQSTGTCQVIRYSPRFGKDTFHT